jgi:hypothetical protein
MRAAWRTAAEYEATRVGWSGKTHSSLAKSRCDSLARGVWERLQANRQRYDRTTCCFGHIGQA